MNARRKTILVMGGVAVTAAAGFFAWHARANAAVVRAARPPAPNLASWPAELRERLAQAGRDSPAALAELSRLYHANGFLAEAARCYVALEKLQPAEPRWPHRRATILAGYGDIEPALAAWRRAVELAPDYLPARLRLAESLAKANRPGEAARAFEDVLRRKPDEPYALLGLARIALEAERWDEARAKLERVAAQTSHELGADLLVAVYERLGERERAAALRGRAKASGSHRDPADPWMDELLELCFDGYRLSLAAGTAARAGDRAAARRWLERAVGLAPNDVALRFQLAGVCADSGGLPQARTHLERCTVIAPTFPDAWAHLGALLERGGDPRGAEQAIVSGLRHCPESPGLHLMRARQLRAAGRNAEALAEYRASIRLRPNEADARLELATTLFRLERVPEGVAELEQALAAEPDHPMALALLALHAIGERNEPAARKWLAAVLNQPRVPREEVEQLRAAFRDVFGSTPR